jgi:hypothetical protein
MGPTRPVGQRVFSCVIHLGPRGRTEPAAPGNARARPSEVEPASQRVRHGGAHCRRTRRAGRPMRGAIPGPEPPERCSLRGPGTCSPPPGRQITSENWKSEKLQARHRLTDRGPAAFQQSSFSPPRQPENLKNWKRDIVLGLAALQRSGVPVSHPPAASPFRAPPIASAALSAASCSDLVERCA